MRRIRQVIVVAAGHWQDRSTLSGSWFLVRDLRDALAAPDVEIILLNWNDDAREWASHIWNLCGSNLPPQIIAAGYSWGGQTIVDLCYALERRGLKVHHLILSDPVVRVRLPLWLAKRVIAFLPWLVLRLPGNVVNAIRFYQRQDKPSGHTVVNWRGCEIKSVELKRGHMWMDDASEYHAEVKRCAGL